MPDNYFEDDAQTDKPMAADAPKGDDKGEKSDQPTFLINSEVCPDMKPGDMMELRIVGVHDGEYEVAYEPKEEKTGSEENTPEEAAAPGPSSPPDSMMD